MREKTSFPVLYQLLVGLLFFMPGVCLAAQYKVLVVMSYDEEYRWDQEIKEGIESVLGTLSEIRYVYMDTKNHLDLGPEKAKEAYKLYTEFQPDGVIAADDNAQSMFVVPYLKDKVATPVIFCGVNADISLYGYPASNVSGVTERLHIGESLAFAQQLIPSIKKVAYMQKESPAGQASLQQFLKESTNYPVESVGFHLPKTLAEAKEIMVQLRNTADALFLETLEGIPDEKGYPLNDRTVIPILGKIFGKPIISNNLYHVEYGTLCAVIKSGQEQGEDASHKLLQAMQGTPIADIPVTGTRKGQPVLNVTVMEELGVKPKPFVLKGVKLIRTTPKFKVLVVMSYEEDFPWDVEVKEGIEAGLGGSSDILYFYMNTKTDLAGGPDRAREAYQLYQHYKPDGVIASDDNAQSMFVVPYLKDKVNTPVMFCGVNAEPEKYGYPARNVSGILERGHIKESIALVQDLLPTVSTIGFMAKESPTGRAVLEQAQKEAESYSAYPVAYLYPKTMQEAEDMAADLRDKADVLFVATMEGLKGADGSPHPEKEIIPLVAKTFGKPLISDNIYDMKYGMFCAIAVSGQEQGMKAAKYLKKAMQGTPVEALPITRNEQGHRMLNVSVMKELGIPLKPSTLIGVELFKTEK